MNLTKTVTVLAVSVPLVLSVGTVVFFPKYLLILMIRLKYSSLGMKRKRIKERDGFEFFYLERGIKGDQPSVLFVHGFSGSVDQWISILDELPRDQHVIVVDLPGHGQTACKEEDASMDAMLRRLKQFVDLIKLSEKPFHIVGQSMGGAVAGCYAALYPDDISMVTMSCPVLRTPEKSELAKMNEEIGFTEENNVMVPRTVAGVKQLLTMCYNSKPKLPYWVMKGILQMRLPRTNFWNNLSKNLRDECFYNDIWLGKYASKIKAPAHVIWADKDQFIHVSGARVLKERLPDLVQFEIYENQGHTITELVPKDYVQSLMTFRAKVAKRLNNDKVL